MKRTIMLLPAILLATLWSCADQSDAMAEKDRIIQDLERKNTTLARQARDSEKARELMDEQLDQNRTQLEEASKARDDELARKETATRQDTEVAKVSVPEVAINDPSIEVVTRSNGEVVLRVGNQVTFAAGSATLTRKGQKSLRKVARTLKKHGGYLISVEGHTDDTPLRSTKKKWKTNMNLSLARALATREFLSKVSGIKVDAMRVVGYGETRPLVQAKTDEARKRNRRVEIVLYKGDN